MNLLQKIQLFDEPLEKLFNVHADCALKIMARMKEFDGDEERLMREVKRLEFNVHHIGRGIRRHFEEEKRKKKEKPDKEVEKLISGWMR